MVFFRPFQLGQLRLQSPSPLRRRNTIGDPAMILIQGLLSTQAENHIQAVSMLQDEGQPAAPIKTPTLRPKIAISCELMILPRMATIHSIGGLLRVPNDSKKAIIGSRDGDSTYDPQSEGNKLREKKVGK